MVTTQGGVTKMDSRHVSDMVTASSAMRGKFPNNLKPAMAEAGLGPTELARRVGTSKQNIARWAEGERRLPPEWAESLAPHLKVEPHELLFEGTGETVPVVGIVGAGSAMHFYAEGQGPFDQVEAPEDSNKSTVAAEIRGTSLGEFFEGGYVFYDQRRSPITEDMHNRPCVVGLADGRVLVKKPKPSKTPGLYHLVSNTEPMITDVEIEWAALVKHIEFRK